MESEKLRHQIVRLIQFFYSVSNPNTTKEVAKIIKELKAKLDATEKAEKLDVYKALTEVEND